ncbi:MAG: phosphoribosylglycinamide formyltransferase [Gemmataceae bacterium]|nr:phosphoribosylglycinamide formyltransferase [Gemmataceae bacterium]
MDATKKLAVLLSGNGTSLQNLIDRGFPIACVVSSRPDAFGLDRARRAGIPAHVVERRGCPSREEFGARILSLCESAGAGLACMAGFLQLLPVPPAWAGRIMNIHPSLLPAFGGKGFHGLHVHEAALAAGVKVSGCTVHFADEQYDQGPIIVQRAVPVAEDDTPESLQARVLAAEREAYPEAIALWQADRLRVEGRLVRIAPA